MERQLMKCGHTSDATYIDKEGVRRNVCFPCSGIREGAYEPETDLPNLEGRVAECCYGCGSSTASKIRLPFFEYLPDRDTDRYYCGCYGWD